MARTALYRHYDAEDRLLYVGISGEATKRINAHLCRSPWRDQITRMDVRILPTREAAREAEVSAIRDEKPLHNIREPGRPTGPRGDRATAHSELADYFKVTGVRREDLANAAGIARSYIIELLYQRRQPSLDVAVRLEAVTGGAVPVASWRNFAAVINAAKGAA